MTQQTQAGHGLLIIVASRSHLDTPQSVGLLWTGDQLVAESSTSQHATLTTERDIRDPSGIRTGSPSKRATTDLPLRPRGHWDRLLYANNLV